MQGVVKWYNPTKGNGFIRPNGSDRGVFVHITAVEKAGLDTLNEGQAVEYQVVTTRGRQAAEQLKAIAMSGSGKGGADRVRSRRDDCGGRITERLAARLTSWSSAI